MAQFREPVRGIGVRDLPQRLETAIRNVEAIMPPQTGVILFAFDFGAGGGMAYISNAERADAIKALKEWIATQERA